MVLLCMLQNPVCFCHSLPEYLCDRLLEVGDVCTDLFAVLILRLAAKVLRVEVLKVRLSHSNGHADRQVWVVDERHVVLIDHVLANAAANTAGGAVTILGVVQVTVDVHPGVVSDAVQLLVIHVIQRLLLVLHLWFLQQTGHQYPHLRFYPCDADLDSPDGNLKVVGLTVVVCRSQVVSAE